METRTEKALAKTMVALLKQTDIELRPCPFCGGAPKVMTESFFDNLRGESKDGSACLTIECPECSLTMYEHTHEIHDYKVRKLMATVKWNQRTGGDTDENTEADV